MGCNIPLIDSVINLGQFIIHICHRVPKCDNWFSSPGLGIWFQVGIAVFCCSQTCRGDLHVLIIFDQSDSFEADLESNLLVVVNYPTLFLDICDRLCRDI